MQKDADISPCKKYRYRLRRTWDERPPLPFVMLNPSRADAEKDDKTITRCIDFAMREGAGGIIVVNLYALREPHPPRLKEAEDPFGPEQQRGRPNRSCHASDQERAADSLRMGKRRSKLRRRQTRYGHSSAGWCPSRLSRKYQRRPSAPPGALAYQSTARAVPMTCADEAKMHSGHGASLEIVLCDTLNIRAISRVGSPASRHLIASRCWCVMSFGGRPCVDRAPWRASIPRRCACGLNRAPCPRGRLTRRS